MEYFSNYHVGLIYSLYFSTQLSQATIYTRSNFKKDS